jgi:hypothetical protein
MHPPGATTVEEVQFVLDQHSSRATLQPDVSTDCSLQEAIANCYPSRCSDSEKNRRMMIIPDVTGIWISGSSFLFLFWTHLYP